MRKVSEISISVIADPKRGKNDLDKSLRFHFTRTFSDPPEKSISLKNFRPFILVLCHLSFDFSTSPKLLFNLLDILNKKIRKNEFYIKNISPFFVPREI